MFSAGGSLSDLNDVLAPERVHERADCALYHACLDAAARGTIRNGKTRKRSAAFVPCRDCQRYQREETPRMNPWRQPTGYNPWGKL